MNPVLLLAALLAVCGLVAVARAVRPAPAPVLAPVEALDRRPAVCPVEGRTTPHAFLRLGGRACLNPYCRATTPGGTR